jgi:MtN3 and saliva related transmembrane protein
MDVALLGWIGTCCSAFAMLPQCIKILRSRSCDGASPLTLAIYGSGAAAWIGYGVHTRDLPLIVSSILALVPTSITLTYVLCSTVCRPFSDEPLSGYAAFLLRPR